MSKDEAIKSLAPFKVEYKGEGEKVIYQSPKGGDSIYEGETVVLYLN